MGKISPKKEERIQEQKPAKLKIRKTIKKRIKQKVDPLKTYVQLMNISKNREHLQRERTHRTNFRDEIRTIDVLLRHKPSNKIEIRKDIQPQIHHLRRNEAIPRILLFPSLISWNSFPLSSVSAAMRLQVIVFSSKHDKLVFILVAFNISFYFASYRFDK